MTSEQNGQTTETEDGAVTLLSHSSPVFIVGSPGSDASTLATSLSASKDFWCSAESHIFYELLGPDEKGNSKLYAAFGNANGNDSFWLPTNRVVYTEFAAYMGLGLDQMFRSRSNGRRWVEASPENTLVSADLAYMFPKARFLTIVRDGRDVVATMLSKGLVSNGGDGFSTACETWRVYAQRILEFQDRFPNRTLEIRHEQVVHGAKKEAKRIMTFLGAADEASVASYLTKAAKDFRENLWWEWDEDQKKSFEMNAGNMMQELGYILDWE